MTRSRADFLKAAALATIAPFIDVERVAAAVPVPEKPKPKPKPKPVAEPMMIVKFSGTVLDGVDNLFMAMPLLSGHYLSLEMSSSYDGVTTVYVEKHAHAEWCYENLNLGETIKLLGATILVTSVEMGIGNIWL